MSCQSRLSANDNGDSEIISTAVHRSPGINLTDDQNPGKPRQETVDEGCTTSNRLKWGSLSPNEIGRIPQQVRKERRKGRGWIGK